MIDPNAMSQGIAGATPQMAAADPQRRPQGQVGGDLLKALAEQYLKVYLEFCKTNKEDSKRIYNNSLQKV